MLVKTSSGLYLVKKLDTRDAVVTPFEQVENSLQRKLLAENINNRPRKRMRANCADRFLCKRTPKCWSKSNIQPGPSPKWSNCFHQPCHDNKFIAMKLSPPLNGFLKKLGTALTLASLLAAPRQVLAAPGLSVTFTTTTINITDKQTIGVFNSAVSNRWSHQHHSR